MIAGSLPGIGCVILCTIHVAGYFTGEKRMPLIILGLILLIGILAYSIVRYINSGDTDTRSVRERYPHAFPPHGSDSDTAGGLFSGQRYEGDYGSTNSDGKRIIFPTDNVEEEKKKRNIH